MYATALSNITAWPLLSDKDGKVIYAKELEGHNCFKYFSMSGEILWQVKPDGQLPPLTEDLQLGPGSKASAEEGMSVTNVPGLREEQVEELADNHDKAGQNTPTSHTVIDIPPGAAP